MNWIFKEQNLRKKYRTTEINKLVLKSLLASSFFSFDLRFFFQKSFLCYNKKSSISFYRNKCLINDWSRSVFRKFKMSRHQAKFFASFGLVCGLRKASF